MSVGELRVAATRRLGRARSETGRLLTTSARLDVSLLLAAALGMSREALTARDTDRPEAPAVARFEAMLARRLAGEPVAYILGEAWFYGRPFLVDARVLVPRPESEHLVEAACDELAARLAAGGAGLRACDVGTGSGALAVTLALEHPEVEIFASDCSADALVAARENAVRLDARVSFLHGDLAEPLRPWGPFDLLIANLPYIPRGVLPQRPEPAGFEPRVALDGGEDGLDLYRRLFAELPVLLRSDGIALCEAAPGTIEALGTLASETFSDAFVEIADDYAGLPRYISVTLGKTNG